MDAEDALTLAQARTLKEIASVRERELADIREFSALEKEVLAEAPSSSSSSSSASGSGREVACQSEEDTTEEALGDKENGKALAAGKNNNTTNSNADKKELARLRAEMESYKTGYELLKHTAIQSYLTNTSGDRKALMEDASRVISLVDMDMGL